MNFNSILQNILGERRSAIRIAGIYILMGALWVLLTDHFIGLFTQDIESFVQYEIIKAWTFILITGMLLYNLILRDFAKITRLNKEHEHVINSLRESKKKNNTLLSLIPDTVYRINSDGVFLDANVPGRKNVFLLSKNIIGKKIPDVLPEAIAIEAIKHVNKAMQTNKLQIQEFSLQINDQTRYYEARILSNEQKEVAVTVRDFTDKKNSEALTQNQQQQLLQADKMATLGIMVSGVAHEINNPNNYILLNGKIVSRMWQDVLPILEDHYKREGDFDLAGMPYTRAHKKIGKLIEGIPEGAQRIQQIVQTFKDFARQDSGELNQHININEVLDSAIIILNNIIKKSTDYFEKKQGENIQPVLGSSQQIEQVIVNLISNSCQAMSDKKRKIKVSTNYLQEKNKVILIVQDEGSGIPKQDIKHIFDPFFTSKRDTGGTGLGLSIAYKIIQNHAGSLSVKSTPGKGTTVTVELPAVLKNS